MREGRGRKGKGGKWKGGEGETKESYVFTQD